MAEWLKATDCRLWFNKT